MKASTLLREYMRRRPPQRGALSRGLMLVGIFALKREVGSRGLRGLLKPLLDKSQLNKTMTKVNAAIREIESLSHSSAVVMKELRDAIRDQVFGGAR